TLVGLCVLGGIFAEGIDLKGDSLIGVAIVGTGLPMKCDENEIYKSYFDNKKLRGFDYAYNYPGISKVTQAGGRVIRTETDKGAILLLDERFLQKSYLPLFPREWLPYSIVNENSLEQELKNFWNE
nr:ATP-dependent DNA helicase [Lachnospiraceae bacterium]